MLPFTRSAAEAAEAATVPPVDVLDLTGGLSAADVDDLARLHAVAEDAHDDDQGEPVADGAHASGDQL